MLVHPEYSDAALPSIRRSCMWRTWVRFSFKCVTPPCDTAGATVDSKEACTKEANLAEIMLSGGERKPRESAYTGGMFRIKPGNPGLDGNSTLAAFTSWIHE